jgi:hypothetical protein
MINGSRVDVVHTPRAVPTAPLLLALGPAVVRRPARQPRTKPPCSFLFLLQTEPVWVKPAFPDLLQYKKYRIYTVSICRVSLRKNVPLSDWARPGVFAKPALVIPYVEPGRLQKASSVQTVCLLCPTPVMVNSIERTASY